MKEILFGLVRRVSYFIDAQPMLALFLGGALLAVFLAAYSSLQTKRPTGTQRTLLWTLYEQFKRLAWAWLLVSFLIGTVVVLRNYLQKTTANFQRTHGRITEANYNAVQTIWGAEQVQGELNVNLFWEDEVTERIESEDLTKPAVLRKKKVRHNSTANPFVSARHDVTLKQNPRKKGSAFYGGYETTCHFSWRLQNPEDRAMRGILKFPLPAATAMYDDLIATLNGEDILPQMQLSEGALVLTRDVAPNEALNLAIAFKSRGVSYWYFQVLEAREIRDFNLTLALPDLPKDKLNYPEGCMTPTHIEEKGTDGTVLSYRLDHAISGKGMGIALPELPQPGQTTSAILGEIEDAWLLTFASVALGLTLLGVSHAAMIAVLFGVACGFGYGLLADFSDLLFGFWGTAAAVLLPLFLFVAWLLMRIVKQRCGRMLAAQVLLFGIVYPSLAGFDAVRASLYFNLCGMVFLSAAAWLLMRTIISRTRRAEDNEATA